MLLDGSGTPVTREKGEGPEVIGEERVALETEQNHSPRYLSANLKVPIGRLLPLPD